MTPYRDHDAVRRSIAVRAEPVTIVRGLFVFGALALVCATSIALLALLDDPDASVGSAWSIGGAFVLVAAGLARAAFASTGTVLRFTIDTSQLTVEWRRRGATLRTEHVALADVVDVALLDEPSSRGSAHRLALGMKDGEIPLSEGALPDERYYAEVRDSIAGFLEVPARG